MTYNPQPTYDYFRRKFTSWQIENGKMASYVPVLGGKEKVLHELEVDASLLKSEACLYIREVGYAQSKNILLQAAEGFAGLEIRFPILGTLDIVMGSLLDLCGYYRRGNALIIKGL
ncbi:MAG: hypothetical protein QXU18_05400 [Thermoplasmatales archaeon]